MDEALFLFIPTVLVAAVLANISIWSHRRLAIRLAALGAAGLMIPLAYASLSELLSRPKPVSMEWMQRAAKEAKVVGSSIRENEAIFVWLQLPDVAEPRAYVLPWNKEMAKQLQGAQRDAAKANTGVQMAKPFDSSEERRTAIFYPEPQQAPPDKQADDGAPVLFKGGQRSWSN